MKLSTMKISVLAAIAAPALLFASGAQAHAHLVKASPAENAAVAAPSAIHLQFSERLEPKFSGVELMKADGAAVPVASQVPAKDTKSIHAVPKAALAPSAYMVMWHIVSADGHKMKGQYNFTVK
jgi:methionine-rich copper-binding protein CopC